MTEAVRAEIPALVDDFIKGLVVVDPYRAGAVPHERLVIDATVTFEYLLHRLVAHCGSPRAIADPAEQVGRDRARRGVPLGALMAAIHLVVSVLWNRFRAHLGDADAAVLVEHVEVLLSVVEEYSRNVQSAYLQEEAVMVQEGDHELVHLWSRLLGGEVGDELFNAVADRLGVHAGSSVLVMAAPASRRDSLWSFYRECWAHHRRPHWLTRAGDVVLVLPLGSVTVTALPLGSSDIPRQSSHAGPATDAALLHRAGAVEAAMAPVCTGVRAVPGAIALARTLASVLPRRQNRAFTLRDGWLSVVASRLGDAAPFIVREVFTGLSARPVAEQERLLETAEVYVRCGSVVRTAELSYCHRNTIVNRMARLRAFTGLDLSVPEQAALFLAALHAREAVNPARDEGNSHLG